jgi:multisubunit Na+/H+ antiporter MnhB subunit
VATLELLLDALLAGALVWAAWSAVAAREAAGGVVLYVVFGLLAALAWLRLEAPDVALAEAAIGAGLTGALLLEAVARRARPRTTLPFRPALALLCAALAVVLGSAVLALPVEQQGLAPTVDEQLADAAAEHPVTAVLLDFRAYDTLLEVAVLLVAALALLAVLGGDRLAARAPPPLLEPQTAWTARAAAPVAVLVALYLLALGTTAPGGAFQAGAVLAAAAVLLRLGGYSLSAGLRPAALRLLLVSGFAVFLAVGLLAVGVPGAEFLEYPADWGGRLVLAAESAIALAVGASLAALFVGAGARLRGGVT